MKTNRANMNRSGMGRILAAALLVIGVVIGFAGIATAQSGGGSGDYVGSTTVVPSTSVLPASSVAPATTAPAAVEAQSATAPAATAAESLAFTGGDALRLAVIGGGLVLAGGAALMLVRRQRVTA